MSTSARTVQINAVDPTSMGADEAQAWADVCNAATAVDAPHVDPVDAAYFRRQHAYGHDLQPTAGLWLARGDDGDPVGYAELHVSVWDNPELAFVDVETHPTHRGSGVGDALLEVALERVRAKGRTELMSYAWAGGSRAAFWERHGLSVRSRGANRRIVVADLDHARLDALLGESEQASVGYELVDLPSPAPDALVPDLLALHLAMNDAPLDELTLEDDQWPVERFRGFEQAMVARGCRLHRLLARRTNDGALGGHTVVVVEEDRPWIAFQEDTAVVAGHRGHRLGIRLKIAMLALLAEREPQLIRIDTWNAESNAHMIAVNDALGCEVVGRSVIVQRTLDP